MKRKFSILAFLLISVMILASCAPQQAGSTGSTATNEPGTAPTETAPADQPVVTLADAGKTISLKVGESFLLKLGNEYTWTISLSNPDIISLRKGVMVILGAQGIYDALKPGTVELTAAGDPQCRQSVPACAAPSIQFSVTIEVQ